MVIFRKHRDKVDINWRDCRGFTVLHSAVIVKDQVDEILFKLMDFEGIDCNLKNQDNNTPLHYFCEYSTSLNCRLIGTSSHENLIILMSPQTLRLFVVMIVVNFLNIEILVFVCRARTD
jgi:hypothetical protein